MKRYMIYTDFERAIGAVENTLEFNVGDFTIVKGRKVMVYANIDLDLDGQAVLHYLFRRGLKKFDRFCDKLNYFVEELINLTNSDFGHRLRIMEDERKCQQIDNLIAFMENIKKHY